MIKRLLCMLLLAVPLCAAAMNNDDIIKLVRSGLSEATLMQAISGADANYDTSPDGLVKLKQGGVSEKVIQQVLARQSAAPAVPGLAPLPAQAAPAQPAAAAPPPPQQQTCADCGTITNIKEVKK